MYLRMRFITTVQKKGWRNQGNRGTRPIDSGSSVNLISTKVGGGQIMGRLGNFSLYKTKHIQTPFGLALDTSGLNCRKFIKFIIPKYVCALRY